MKNSIDKIFYLNTAQNSKVTYEDLFFFIRNVNSIKTNYSFTNTKDFILNFLSSVFYNVDINLHDLNSLNSKIDSSKKLKNVSRPKSLEEIIIGIKTSKSKIKLYTSGTTGQPKEIIHNIKNLSREVREGDKFKNNIWAFAYNPTHMAGIQVLFQGLFNKNSFYDVFELTKDQIINILHSNGITNISATPTFFRLLVPIKEPIVSVKNVSLGGEKSNNELQKKIKESFPNAKVLNIYASTEAGTLFSTSGNYFKISPDIREFVKIIDNELIIHKTLLGNIDKNKLVDGIWYKSGDLVNVVNKETNEFKIISRKNEMINVGGNKVNPIDVESIIDNIDGIEKSYIYGKVNSVLGNILCAKVQLRNSDLTANELRKVLMQKLPIYQIPRKIEFVHNLKLTRTGKLRRYL